MWPEHCLWEKDFISVNDLCHQQLDYIYWVVIWFWNDCLFPVEEKNFTLRQSFGWCGNQLDCFYDKGLRLVSIHQILRKPGSAIFIGNFIGNVKGSFLWHTAKMWYEIVILPMKFHRKLHRRIALPGFRKIPTWDYPWGIYDRNKMIGRNFRL